MALTIDIAHRWANKQLGKTGSLTSQSTHCTETSFYSYSTVIGQWLDKKRKIMAVLDIPLTKTTSRHLADLRRAIPVDVNVFYLHSVKPGRSGWHSVDFLDYNGDLNPMNVTENYLALLMKGLQEYKDSNALIHPGRTMRWWDELERWQTFFPGGSVKKYLRMKLPEHQYLRDQTIRTRKVVRALMNNESFESIVDIVNGDGCWAAYFERTKGVRTAEKNRRRAEKIARHIGFRSVKSSLYSVKELLKMSPGERMRIKFRLLAEKAEHSILYRRREASKKNLYRFLGIKPINTVGTNSSYLEYGTHPYLIVDPASNIELYRKRPGYDYRLPRLKLEDGWLEKAKENPLRYRKYLLDKAKKIGRLAHGAFMKKSGASPVSDYDRECIAAYEIFVEKVTDRSKKRVKREAEKRERREADRLKKEEERKLVIQYYKSRGIDGYRDLWRERYDSTPTYGNFSSHEFFYGGNVLLRYNEVPQLVETSKSIRLSINQAKKMWRLVSKWHQSPTLFRRIPVPTQNGSYTTHSFDNDILTVGCHAIAFVEMERIAKQLGFI